MKRPFSTFLGVDLGGGKGKTTAVARLVADGDGVRVIEVDVRAPRPDGAPDGGAGPGARRTPWYDHVLIDYLRRHRDGAVLAIDAPLTATACVRCRLPECLTLQRCDDPTIVWFRTAGAALLGDRDAAARGDGKPRATPYTQRATEVVLHKRHHILPRETLGQGMGPLTSRALYLRRALEADYRLHDNLLEVYPKATLATLFGARARRYKRHPDTWSTRAAMLEALAGDLRFGTWREGCLANDHNFDAVVCAYTAYLWARDGWELPAAEREVFADDGWIWFPPTPGGAADGG